jgi:hypothetical protein
MMMIYLYCFSPKRYSLTVCRHLLYRLSMMTFRSKFNLTSLSLHKDCSFAGTDHTPTVEVIVVNESSEQLNDYSSNNVPHDPGWELFFGRKIKFKGEGVRALKSLFLQSPDSIRTSQKASI